MPIDSTADLLFRIGANSDDAEDNIGRFRSLLSKDLTGMSAEFGDWAKEIFGDVSTVTGALTAVGAVSAAALVAVGAAAVEASNHYAEYVSEVDRGSRVTGISVEQMSGLKFAAAETGTSYEGLVQGLTRFTYSIVQANEGSKQYADAFTRMGISQEQLKAGEKDMMPLLNLVADKFKDMGSTVEKTAIAREIFSRGGAELVRMLSQGSEALKDFNKEAASMGLIITTQDVVAVQQYKAAVEALKAEHEALDVEIGKNTLPIMEKLKIGFVSLLQTMGHIGQGDFWTQWSANFAIAQTRVDALAKSLAKLDTGDKPLGAPDTGGAKEATEAWTGLADVLRKVRDATIDTASVDERTRKEYGDLQVELDKTTKKFEELKQAGKISPADIAESQKALAAMPAALAAVLGRYIDEIAAKNKAAGEDLERQILGQGQQTLAVRVALWDQEMAKLREKLTKEKSDTSENLALLAALTKAGYDKIGQEAGEAVRKAGDALEHETEAQSERSYQQKRDTWNKEIDARADALAKEEALTDENMRRLEALRAAGLAKIDAEAKAAGDSEIARLQEQLHRIEETHQTEEQRIEAGYQADLARYVAAEQKKSLTLATNEAQRTQILAMFAAIRKGLTDKEAADLQQLHNSQGWQGVFGAAFAQDIQRDEALLKQWATSAQQSHLMVKVSLESLKEMGQQTFQQFAQAEGAAIASAMVYSKSIGAAMEAALKSTLESLAARAFTQAIYSMALGFLYLAEQDYEGAGQAFTAAAIFGSVGAAAGIAGRAIPSGDSGAGGSGSGASGRGGNGPGVGQFGSQTAARQADEAAGFQPGATAAYGRGQHVTMNVYGHVVGVSGVQELMGMMNDAVLNQGATLTATNTKTGVQVTR